MIHIVALDETTLSFITFSVGLIIGLIVPAISDTLENPGAQKAIAIFMTFMALISAAITAGQIVAPAVFVGMLAGYIVAVSADQARQHEVNVQRINELQHIENR